jgi:hypothetical protein
VSVAAADGSPCAPGVQEPVGEHGTPSVHPKIQNSRRGRVASPHGQGRETDVFIGIDVSKDRLDVCVRPSGESSRPFPEPAPKNSLRLAIGTGRVDKGHALVERKVMSANMIGVAPFVATKVDGPGGQPEMEHSRAGRAVTA